MKEEQIYYEKLIGKENFYLIRKQNQNDIYKIINDYNYFAVISSSVGYEALSRAKRVAFLNVHHNISNYLEGEKLKYGYPADLPLKGPFWTNDASQNEIFRVLDFLINSSKEEWSKFKDKYISPAIIYDENNKNFKEKTKFYWIKYFMKNNVLKNIFSLLDLKSRGVFLFVFLDGYLNYCRNIRVEPHSSFYL